MATGDFLLCSLNANTLDTFYSFIISKVRLSYFEWHILGVALVRLTI
jgi:hypothetical protein